MGSLYCLVILDDEAAWAEDLRARIMRHPAAGGFDVELCHSSNELVDFYRLRHIDILFADICLGDVAAANGIDVVSSLNLRARGTQVVYVTGLDDMYGRVRASQMSAHFLKKPVRDEELYSVLDKAVLAVESWSPKPIILDCFEGKSRIDPRKIMYVEVKGRTLYINLENTPNPLHVNERLFEFKKMLPDFFYQVHRSYLVNMHYAQTLAARTLCLCDGTKIPVPPARHAAVQEALVRI